MNKLMTVARVLTTERLFVLILFASASIGIEGYGSDVFLHLTTGKHILSTGELPHVDTFSFTKLGERWVMHEWLYQVFLYYLHESLGEVGLKFFGAGILASILYINKRNCEIVGASNFASWVSTLIMFLAWMNFIGLRPHIVTYLFFVISLHSILLFRYQGKNKPLYIIPLIMVPWVNSHGGFLIGIVLLAYITILSLIENNATRNRHQVPWPLVISLVLTILASLANPYGIEQLLFPLQLMDQWVMNFVTEWQAPDFSLWNNVIYLLAVITFFLLPPFNHGNERWFRIIFVSPFIIASFDAVRHLPLASFIMTPYLAAQITTLPNSHISSKLLGFMRLQKNRNNRHPGFMKTELGALEYLLNWIMLLCFGIAMYFLYPVHIQLSTSAFNKDFPVGATKYLINNDTHGRMFTTMQYSDYILFSRYPDQKLFYDVRLEIYGKELSRDYLTMVNAQEGWQDLFNKYSIDYAVLDKSKPIYTAFTTAWNSTMIYEDKHSAIFLLSNTDQ